MFFAKFSAGLEVLKSDVLIKFIPYFFKFCVQVLPLISCYIYFLFVVVT